MHAPFPQVKTEDALAAVRRLSFATLDAPDARAIYDTLAAELLDVFAVDGVHLARVAPDGTVSRGIAFERGAGGDAEVAAEYMLRLAGRPTGVGYVRETGKPLSVPDARSSELVAQDLVERFDANSILFVPIAYEHEVRAVMLLMSQTPRRFSEKQVALAYTMANQAATGLAVLEMRERLARRADRQAALARAAAAMNERLDLRGVLDTLCQEADHAIRGDMAGVYLGDAASGGVAVAGHGVPEDSDWWGSTIRAGEGVAGEVLATGEPATSDDAVSVPVRWNGELKGALSVAFLDEREVSDEELETLQAIADLAAIACSNAEAFEQVQAAARTDSLTGFLNHGAVQVRIREEIWRARRADTPLSCLLLDIDNFKPINDRHGHLVGDEILSQVATAIATEFRPYDGLARYGGDELVLVLPGMDERDARDAADRVRSAVAAAATGFGDLGVPVTASVGVAQWREPLTAGELLDRADRALLLAKRRGKDQVVVASATTERELAEIDEAGPTQLMSSFWDMVSRCERPRDMLFTLPWFMRRELELEEVALYRPGASRDGRTLLRATVAKTPGDPTRPAFSQTTITLGDGLLRRLETGALSRDSFASLRRALEAAPGASGSEETAGSYAAIGLTRGDDLHGILLLRHHAPSFPRPILRLAEVVAGQAVTVLLGQSGGGSPSAVQALAAAIDARDNYTLEHSEQVVGLACDVARKLRLPPAEVAMVRDGAMLHDVGKVAIPNEILYKNGPLTEHEWAVMRQHPVIGERILRRTPELAQIAPLVRHEHERWDGTGYPDGLAGPQIPIGSRIILACDAYNAMITRRPYREPMSQEDAIAELRRGAGSQFDPDVVEALLQVLAAREPVASPAG